MTPQAFLRLVETKYSHNPGFVKAMKKIMAGEADDNGQDFAEFVRGLVAEADAKGQIAGLTRGGSRAGSGGKQRGPRK